MDVLEMLRDRIDGCVDQELKIVLLRAHNEIELLRMQVPKTAKYNLESLNDGYYPYGALGDHNYD